MFESWGRMVYARRAVGPGPRGDRGGGRGGLGDRGVRLAAVGGGFTAPGSQSQREATSRPGPSAATPPTWWCCTPARGHRARRRVPVGRHQDPGRAARRPRSASVRDLLVDRLAAVRLRRAARRRTPCSSWPAAQTPPGPRTIERIAGRPRRARPDHPGGRPDPHQVGDQQAGDLGHRPGRGHLHAGAAHPAAGDLRQPGRGQPAAGHRRASASSARSPRCGC